MKTNRSLQRCLLILQSFRLNGRQTLSELARATDLPHATALRFLQTLEFEGYVVREAARWRLTTKTLEIGFAALESLGMSEIVQQALDELAGRYSGTANIGELSESGVVIIARAVASAERRRLTIRNIRVGSILPLDSALGQAMRLSPGCWAERRYPEIGQISFALLLPETGERRLAIGISTSEGMINETDLQRDILVPLQDEASRLGRLIGAGFS